MTTLVPKYSLEVANTYNRPFNEVLSESVRVSDFIPSGVIADYTTYIQNAVDYCLTNRKNLFIDQVYAVAGQIIVNRLEATGTPWANEFDYFTVWSNTGGGFQVSADNEGIFKTNLINNVTEGTPLSQGLRFIGITFASTAASFAAYAVRGGGRPRVGADMPTTFRRVVFDTCTFIKIKCVVDGHTSFLQSWYWIDCLATKWSGDFVNSTRAYDIQVLGGRYEGNAGGCFVFTWIHGSKFETQIESMVTTDGGSGIAIGCAVARGVDISCYFEGNAIDVTTVNTIDPLLLADLIASGYDIAAYGVNIHGSLFSGGGTGTVRWRSADKGCSSIANMSLTTPIHNLPSASIIDINDYVGGQGAAGNIAVDSVTGLATTGVISSSGIRSGTVTLGVTGGAASVVATYTKIGPMVFISFLLTEVNNGTVTGFTGLPFPALLNSTGSVYSYNGSVATSGLLTYLPLGTSAMNIYNLAGSNSSFVIANVSGERVACEISYQTAMA